MLAPELKVRPSLAFSTKAGDNGDNEGPEEPFAKTLYPKGSQEYYPRSSSIEF